MSLPAVSCEGLLTPAVVGVHRLEPWFTHTGGGRRPHPLAVLPTEHGGRGLARGGGVWHAHALGLLHQRVRERLGEGGEGAGDGGTLLEEDADGEQGHTRALSLER